VIRFAALLRGVNVGKGKRVPMAALRALLVNMGYTDVTTLLNSGNAVFCAAKGASALHAAAIAAALSRELNVDVPVVVKSASQLAGIVAGNPLAAGAFDPSRLLVAYVQDEKSLSSLAAVARLIVPPERFVIGKNAAYLHCPNGILGSKAGEVLLGKAGTIATTRNWSTTLKLNALANRQA
jgi:uncharacterized protein (DUF1697 family)